MSDKIKGNRRVFMKQSGAGAATLLGVSEILRARNAPAQVRSLKDVPSVKWGLQIGDVLKDRAVVWSRTDRDARLVVEWFAPGNARDSQKLYGPLATAATDYTSRVDLKGLPQDRDIIVKAYFEKLHLHRGRSDVLKGQFHTAPKRSKPVRFLWTGDTCGQGWGIDLDFGGMRAYEAMCQTAPDFLIHCGDTIYADGPMSPEVTDSAGNVVWRNAYLDAVPEKLKVAETLHEFRRNYLYNLYDEHVRAFNAEVPQIWQWDDHEIVNNWSPAKVLDARYTETDINVLVPRARQAFLEYAPGRFPKQDGSGRIYRKVSYGEDLDIFVLDMRTYRAGNSCNVQPKPGPETVFLGQEQINWLKDGLKKSKATWKAIASDMPLGLIVADGTDPVTGCRRGENSANGDGPVLGREFEIADILSFIKHQRVKNVVWFTADVHYCAAHYYDPSVAQFQDFKPFWEFVSGPIHAGSFGPNALDNTFGPTVIFEMAPPLGQVNLPPSAGLQFFGQVDINPYNKAMTVTLKDLNGSAVFSQEVAAE